MQTDSVEIISDVLMDRVTEYWHPWKQCSVIIKRVVAFTNAHLLSLAPMLGNIRTLMAIILFFLSFAFVHFYLSQIIFICIIADGIFNTWISTYMKRILSLVSRPLNKVFPKDGEN